jgi:hypothetical protein
MTRSFFALSTIRQGLVFYSRCNFSAQGEAAAIHCFDVVYPAEQKRPWDAIVTRISRSLPPARRLKTLLERGYWLRVRRRGVGARHWHPYGQGAGAHSGIPTRAGMTA